MSEDFNTAVSDAKTSIINAAQELAHVVGEAALRYKESEERVAVLETRLRECVEFLDDDDIRSMTGGKNDELVARIRYRAPK